MHHPVRSFLSLLYLTEQCMGHQNAHLDVLEAIPPKAPEIWRRWKDWVDLDERAVPRDAWPAWRKHVFRDIGINETRFLRWYRDKTRTDAHERADRFRLFCLDFFELVCEFFFDQSCRVTSFSKSLRANLRRLGMHKQALDDILRHNNYGRHHVSVFLAVYSHDRLRLCTLATTLVYERMLFYDNTIPKI